MNDSVEMSFSGLLGGEKHRYIAVSFTLGEKYAEGEIPSCRIRKNKGFSQEEVQSLEAYMYKNRDEIFRQARKINPMRAFLGL
ncbi:MAG TPA: hypothetical protein DCL38_08140 [Lachnospiraceae bacterium]|nr:hypothetical protein [Lachnospiraceae bacterium]